MLRWIRAVQMDNFRGFIGITRIDRVPNTHIKEWRKGRVRGRMKVLSVGLAILKELKRIGLLKGYMWETESVWVVVY